MASTAVHDGALQDDSGRVSGPPAIALPKGGGAIRGIGEKFAANPVTGTGSMTVPIATTPGRQGFGPQLALSYDTGFGNGLFGFGWSLGLPAITRKTDKGLPRYHDAGAVDSDVFLLSGAEDLVPILLEGSGGWDTRDSERRERDDGSVWRVERYRPRVEGLFARIERWTQTETGEIHWRSISKDNVTTLYGRTSESRVADPADGKRVFAWLICESFDDKGNAIAFAYEAESSEHVDASAAHEANRDDRGRAVNRHLKRIRYGNPTPHVAGEDLAGRADWLFEVVFDYGEHDPGAPEPGERGGWLCRRDPFSTRRPGFEVRTYRLCQRVLMFHHFPREAGVGVNCLVRSTDFTYRSVRGDPDDRAKGHPVATFLASVVQSGYRRRAGGYLKRSQPPLEFDYSEPTISEDVLELDGESAANLPEGIDGARARWLDRDGEGLTGVLIEAAGTWGYKRNLGPSPAGARLGPLEPVGRAPAPFETRGGGRQFLDLAGDGRLDLVSLAPPLAGYHERSADDDSWSSFTPFESLPRIAWDDPDLRLLDVTGDARTDALVSRDGVVTWYPSLGEAGFGAPETVPLAFEDDRGVRHVLADRSQSIFVADVSGDGLGDLVRVRNGEVSYWPNRGYGRFGAPVVMDDAPWFDTAERFEPGRIRVDDIDGSGTGDLIYLGPDEVQVYFNEAGNGWSERHVLRGPVPGDPADVSVVDLLGNGTACLVWSSSSPADARRPIRYLDLMGGQKPHLLVGFRNNLGAETHIQYAPSTKFSARSRAAGRPWRTRLPFPVHVVERVETLDHVGGTRFVTRYAYEEGRFDGREREFCGFGHVKRWDTEEPASLDAAAVPAANLDAASHVPPVLTKSWIHTGAHLDDDRVSRQFEADYYQEPGLSPDERQSLLLDDTVLPGTILRGDGTRLPHRLSHDEEREACRALKGTILRQEIYALDGTEAEERPYLVTEGNATVELLQPQGANRHAVFFTHAREKLQLHYERALFPVGPRRLADPRVAHTLQLAVDPFGNVERGLEITYGRRRPDPDLPEREQSEQTRAWITCTENGVTAPIDEPDEHRAPVPWETRTYELTVVPPVRARMAFGDALAVVTTAQVISYEQEPSAGVSQKRLIEHVRTSFCRGDLGGALPFGQLQSPALPFETYRLALTPGLVDEIYEGRVDDATLGEAGYVHSAGDAQWWIPSGRAHYSPRSADTPAQELAHAQRHFFLPHRFRDPFHSAANSTESFVTYDEYDLLVEETRDALGNRVTVGERDPDPTRALIRRGQDYRVLQPALVMDPNRNRSAAAFDAFGMVAGTALMGKPEDLPTRGDALTAAFRADLTQDEIAAFFADPRGPIAATLLDAATTRVVYDLSADPAGARPAFAATLARETHADEPAPAGGLRIQVSFGYSDGFGREIQRKLPAAPGPVPVRDAEGRIVVGPGGEPAMTPNDVAPRWVGSGWTVFNNKGKPVRTYDPFFTDTHRFESDVRIGVSAVLFYDPVDRVVATLHPDHTWEKVRFDPWSRQTWDVSDTVLVPDPAADPDVGGFFVRLPDADYLPTWHGRRVGGALGLHEQQAARKAEVHAGTPTRAHADTLGRTFLTVTHNRVQYSGTPTPAPGEEFASTRVVLDIEGNEREIVDPEGRVVSRLAYDMLGVSSREAGMEAGARWTLHDAVGKPLYAWDSLGRRFRTTYDRLRRPADSLLLEGAAELLIGRSVYGEASPDPATLNLRGKLAGQFDQAGKITHDEYDFKGNVRHSSRELAIAYKTTLDWTGNVPLDGVVHPIATRYDALNRPTEQTAPDGSVLQRAYDESGRLRRVAANLRGAQSNGQPVWTRFVDGVSYDARGRRVMVALASGAGVTTTYAYDRRTSRLTNLVTRRAAASFPDDCLQPAPVDWPGCQVQNLHYTYDPAGNITHIRDTAQQTVFFRNKRVEPDADYTYDATFRLIEATGREHLGQVGGAPLAHSYDDAARRGIPWSANDGDALGRFLERYVYDRVGNIGSIQHVGTDPSAAGWRRTHTHDEPSLLEPGRRSNRLTSATIGGATEVYSTNGDGYDAHGCMLRMPQLHALEWDFDNRLRMTQRQAVDPADLDGLERHGERTYYVYDGAGQRVRKVTELAAGAVKDERVYLGGLEVFRRHGVAPLVRETLHVMDDTQRIAIVETRTQGNEPGVPIKLVRYQFGNHLGSSSLELDDQAQIVSYEEYTPYGSTSYQAVRNRLEAPKRYRYTGKERDEESGLYYHGARYYAPWIARWTEPDPSGLVDDINRYAYVRGIPTSNSDPTGRYSWEQFGADVIGGVKGAALGLVDPLLQAVDLLDMSLFLVAEDISGVTMPDKEFVSGMGRKIEAGGDPVRAGFIAATAMPSGGATVLVDNLVTVYENDMSADEAASFLTQGAVGQVVAVGVGASMSKASGGGWTGRGPAPKPNVEAATSAEVPRPAEPAAAARKAYRPPAVKSTDLSTLELSTLPAEIGMTTGYATEPPIYGPFYRAGEGELQTMLETRQLMGRGVNTGGGRGSPEVLAYTAKKAATFEGQTLLEFYTWVKPTNMEPSVVHWGLETATSPLRPGVKPTSLRGEDAALIDIIHPKLKQSD